jgi:cation diffusion facilitator CzcD-associated flavoprotein CzcO
MEIIDSDTVIVGASAAGIAAAACLRRARVPFVLLEQSKEIASAWRKHYERLHLHTNKGLSSLPHGWLRQFRRRDRLRSLRAWRNPDHRGPQASQCSAARFPRAADRRLGYRAERIARQACRSHRPPGIAPRLRAPRSARPATASLRAHDPDSAPWAHSLLDVGTIARIRRREIDVLPGVESFTPGGARFSDGTERAFEAVVLATGYRPALAAFLEPAKEVLDEEDVPIKSGAETLPGLYFCGFHVAPTGMFRDRPRGAAGSARHRPPRTALAYRRSAKLVIIRRTLRALPSLT